MRQTVRTSSNGLKTASVNSLFRQNTVHWTVCAHLWRSTHTLVEERSFEARAIRKSSISLSGASTPFNIYTAASYWPLVVLALVTLWFMAGNLCATELDAALHRLIGDEKRRSGTWNSYRWESQLERLSPDFSYSRQGFWTKQVESLIVNWKESKRERERDASKFGWIGIGSRR